MGLIARITNFVNGTLADADAVDAELDLIHGTINGDLDTTNLAPDAGIKGSQCATGANSMATANHQDDSITDAKLADHASNDALRAVSKNHCKNSIISLDKLHSFTYLHSSSIVVNASSEIVVSTGLSSVTLTPTALVLLGGLPAVEIHVDILVQSNLINIYVRNPRANQLTIAANVIQIRYIFNT